MVANGTTHGNGASAAEALALVRRLYTAGSIEEIEALLADDVVVTDWVTPGVELRGRASVMERSFAPSAAAFEDASEEELYSMATPDRVLFCGRFSALFAGDYLGIPAHGRHVSWTILDTFEIRDASIARIWFGADTLAAAKALGAIAEAGAPW